MSYSQEREDRELNDLLGRIGRFIRSERVNLGYSSAAEFANELEISPTQMIEYENGKVPMTLKTFHRIIRGLGKSPEEIFTSLVLQGAPTEILPPNTLPASKAHQLRLQVKTKVGSNVADALSAEELYRLHEIVKLASRREVRKSEIRDAVGLKTYTRAFNRLMEVALRAELIRLKYPGSLHHKNQRYLAASAT